MKIRTVVAGLLLVVSFAGGGQAARVTSDIGYSSRESLASQGRYYRTELYFGLAKPNGSEVTAEEWAQFLADEVTPRFPAGFTVIETLGQYQGDDKKIVKEKSRVLILLYEKKDRKGTGVKIEEIRAAYKKAFQQESVMRLDMRQTVNVSF